MPQTFPFSWQIRVSKRVRRPKITLDKHGLVELVCPEGMPANQAQAMMSEHIPWVVKHLEQLQPQHDEVFPPLQLDLLAIGQQWQVHYQAHHRQRLRLTTSAEQLCIEGDVLNHEAVRLCLCHWVKTQGKRILLPWLAEIAEEMGESYASVSIRLQKRRWGSCSMARRINLNAALLFLPPTLLRHVLIHELAHLRHHNHSAKFWAWVAQFDPDYQQNRQQLQQQGQLVPTWLVKPAR